MTNAPEPPFEIVPAGDLDYDGARRLTDQLSIMLEVSWQLVVTAYTHRAHEALGYPSWDAYCEAEFASSHMRVPREDRDEVVTSMRTAGMSVRAIGAATGLGRTTVARVIKALDPAPEPDELSLEPDLVTGTDGRERPGARTTKRELFERRSEAVALRGSGMPQTEIARRLGVTQPTVSQDLKSMDDLASSQGVNLAELTTPGGRLDARALAARLNLDTRPAVQLATITKSLVTQMQANVRELMTQVVLADGWIEDGERAAAQAVMVPALADTLLELAKIVEQIDSATIGDEVTRVRWTRTIADAASAIAKVR